MAAIDKRFLVLVLLALALWNCDGGCSCGEPQGAQVPQTPRERLEVYAQHLPAQTELATFFVDMDGVRGSTSGLSARFKGSLPVDAYRQEVQRVVGVDLLEKASYAQAGIHPDGGLAVGYYRETPVVMLYVQDKAKFQAQALKSLQKYYRVKDAPVASKDSPGVFTLRNEEVELSYHFGPGGLLTLAGGQLKGKQEPATAARLGEVLAVKPENSLGRREEFQKFAQKFGEGWPMAVYMDAPRLLELGKEWLPGVKGYQKEIMDAVATHVRWGGAGWKMEGDAARGRLFLGVKKETLDKFKGLEAVGDKGPAFDKLIGEGTYAFVRMSMDAALFWKEYQALMPETQRRYVGGVLSNLKNTAHLDVEADLIQNTTGHVALAVYGVNPLMMVARRATDRMKSVTLALHIQLKDAARVQALLDKLVQELLGSVQRRELEGGVVAYGFDRNSSTAPPFTVYLKGDLLTLASNALAEPQLVARLSGGSSQGLQLPGLKSQAARDLFSSKQATGLYLDVARVRRLIGPLGGQLVSNLLGPQEELVSLVKLDADGLDVNGTIQLEAAPQAQGAADQGKDQ